MSSAITILFGNGIGMAMSPDYFTLQQAVNTIFPRLTSEEQQSIAGILEGTIEAIPEVQESSPRLAALNMLSFLTQAIKSLSNNQIPLLSDYGTNLEVTLNKFLWETSYYFHRYSSVTNEFNDFCSNLSEYLRGRFNLQSKTHIATTNYDDLLYGYFERSKIFDSDYSKTILVDGFDRGGVASNPLLFDPSKMHSSLGDRYFGWYLHLHGSPLLYSGEESNLVYKMQRDAAAAVTAESFKTISPHVVLNHYNNKVMNIGVSRILREYLTLFSIAVSESEIVYLIGISGKDPHLNESIRNALRPNTKLIVVEYSGEGSLEERARYWQDIFGAKKQIEVILHDSILDFRFDQGSHQ